MKINILTPGRFHVMDLARELDRNGHDVKFYSFVPTKRAMKFGLPKRCSASLIAIIAPFLLLVRLFRGRRWPTQIRIRFQDFITSIVMRDCDILIAMSGDFVRSLKVAKKKGALIIVERGSKHILEQKAILESIPSLKGKKPVPDMNVKRELECYELADYISIASTHVKRSFLKHGYPEEKLFVNPYGVDLSMFYPIKQERKYDFIMVGGWSYRKGCDLIIEAIQNTEYSLLHVGGFVDIDFPHDNNFTHIDSVDQSELVCYYHRAKILLLPSREEGLSMVQAQAIACNLPIVGSPDSGAEDLKCMVEKPENIIIIKDYTVESVIDGIKEGLRKYDQLNADIYSGDVSSNLTWKAYGDRYNAFIRTISKQS